MLLSGRRHKDVQLMCCQENKRKSGHCLSLIHILFVAMPNKKMPNGEYRDVAHPIHSGMRAVLEEVILGEYYNVLKA